MQKKDSIRQKYLFEVSFEVVNKVGGINTVLVSKIDSLLKYYSRDQYFMIGPYIEEKARGEFKEEKAPVIFQKAIKELSLEGIVCHYGTWLVDGSPNVLLLDYKGVTDQVTVVKKELWEKFHVDSLADATPDFDNCALFGYAAARFLCRTNPQESVVQCHEWQSGSCILYLKVFNCSAGTVFTTHATTLGRTLSGAGVDIYENEEEALDREAQARFYGVLAKHSLEKAAAQAADVLTTVSEITGRECDKFLGRKPEVILPNGLASSIFINFEDVTLQHRIFRNRIREFLFYYFFPYYSFDVTETLFYFFAGRYEFINKGIDVYIESLGKLNEMLKKEKSSRTIVSFIWVPVDGITEIQPQISRTREIFFDIEDDFEEINSNIHENLLYRSFAHLQFTRENILGEEFAESLDRKLFRFKEKGLPPLVSHILPNEGSDEIVQACKKAKLLNKEDDKVKVIFFPIYLTGHDGLLNLSYRECLIASHLGVFPSLYEPWGYTPLETAAVGVCSVTPNISGFGDFVLKNAQVGEEKCKGVFVFERGKNHNATVEGLTEIMYEFNSLSKTERIENKIKAREIASLANWDNFIENYIEAQNLAFKKRNSN